MDRGELFGTAKDQMDTVHMEKYRSGRGGQTL